jgi:hypothetical protein
MNHPDARRHSPAAERNRGPILEVLRRELPPRGRALEIAAGTGQHAVHFAAGLPDWAWCPSDPDPSAVASMAVWAEEANLPNLRPAVALDVMSEPWPVVGPFDAIFCANMLHISPWPTCAALMRGAARLAATDAVLLTYGPFFVEGQTPSPGNAAFDADLRARDPAWGLRFVHDVEAQALAQGWHLQQSVSMPANNLTLVFRRARA